MTECKPLFSVIIACEGAGRCRQERCIGASAASSGPASERPCRLTMQMRSISPRCTRKLYSVSICARLSVCCGKLWKHKQLEGWSNNRGAATLPELNLAPLRCGLIPHTRGLDCGARGFLRVPTRIVRRRCAGNEPMAGQASCCATFRATQSALVI